MSEPRDPLFDAIHAAGEVPPPPDRDAAFARAMQPVLMTSRRRMSRSVIALFVAAMVAVPAAVFAARSTHPPTAVLTPIVKETADPDVPLTHEVDDSKATHEIEHGTERSTSGGTDDHSGSSNTSSSDDTQHVSGDSANTSSGDGSNLTSGDTSSPSPTRTESGGSGSSDGGSLSSDGGSVTPSSSPSPEGSASPTPH